MNRNYKFMRRIFVSLVVLSSLILSIGKPVQAVPIEVSADKPTRDHQASIPDIARPSDTAATQTTIDPYVYITLEKEGKADILVILKSQADLDGAAELTSKAERGQFVYQQLVEIAESTQPTLRAFLEGKGAPYRSYWIRNQILVQADASLLMELAARPEVERIEYLHPAYPDPIDGGLSLVYGPVAGPQLETPTSEPEGIEWNILRVNADDVWSLGITGAGAVVGHLDTGVQWDHPALVNAYRPQIPGAPTRHDYNWWNGPDGAQIPLDYGTHGTGTMGIIVGDDGGENQIGMAPSAQWMACAGLGNDYANPFDCFQFFLAPTQLDGSNPRPDLAPHVINNSWSSLTDYRDIIHTVYLAGIFYAKSAGNDGPGCGTLTNPGQWPEVTATAAFAQGDTIANSSSRGPAYVDHRIVVKPDIAAPGEYVRTSRPGNTYDPDNDLSSGTSIAAPHVTGAVALLISARPGLAGEVDLMQMILKQTAEVVVDAQCQPFVGHPNNVWGWGILDAYAAVLMAQGIGLGEIQGQVVDDATSMPLQGARLTFEDASTGWGYSTETIANGTYSDTIPVGTYDVMAAYYGYQPDIAAGVGVISGSVTIQDFSLLPVGSYVVSGTVTDAAAGWPLYAHLILHGDPLDPPADLQEVWTDPATGLYSLTLAGGITYTFSVQAFVDGYFSSQFTVDPLEADIQVDVALAADLGACLAPGYVQIGGSCQLQPGGLVVGNVFDANTGDAVVNAMVANDSGETTRTQNTPEDLGIADAYYTLFSPAGLHVFTSTLVGANGFDVAQVTVVQSDTVRQDFNLPAGWLSTSPEGLAFTITIGHTDTKPLTLTNMGSYTTAFEVGEIDRGFDPGLAGGRQPDMNQPFSWMPAAPIPHETSLYGFAQCADDPDTFYVIAGRDETGSINLAWRYDAEAGEWSPLTNFPSSQIGLSATCYQGTLYAAGGASNNQIRKYVNHNWVYVTGLPRRMFGSALGSWGGKLYFAGGTLSGSPFPPVNLVNIYDLDTNTWSLGSPMPVAASFAGYTQTGPYLYVVGGLSGDFGSNVSATQRYDMSTDTWELGPTFSSARAVFALAATQSYLYAMGGDADGGSLMNRSDLVEILDHTVWPGSAWSDLGDPLPQPVVFNSAGFCTEAVTGGEVWSVGGNSYSGAIDNNWYHHAEPCYKHPSDVPWLQVAPVSGTIPIGGETILDIVFDAGAPIMQTGVYYARLWVFDDTPYGDHFIPVVLTVEPEYGVTLTPESAALSGLPGETLTYTLTVSNTGSHTDTFDVVASGVWTTTAAVSVGPLGPDEATDLLVTVVVPLEAVAGDFDVATVTATSQADELASDSATLTTTVLIPPEYGVEIAPDSLGLSGSPGDIVTYALSVTNTGDTTDTIILSANGYTWTVHLPVTQTTLGAGEAIQVIVHVTIPERAMDGEMDVATITATSQGDPLVWDSATLTTTAVVEPPHEYVIYLPVVKQ